MDNEKTQIKQTIKLKMCSIQQDAQD